MISISQAILQFLQSVSLSRSENTARSYKNALRSFSLVLEDHGINDTTNIDQLTEDAVSWFAVALKHYSPATEQMYLTAVAGFFEYLAAERLLDPNLPRVRLLIRQRARKPGQRLPQFPRENIEKIINYAINLAGAATQTETRASAQHARQGISPYPCRYWITCA